MASADPVTTNPGAGRPHPALAGLVGSYQGYRQQLPAPGRHRGLPSCVMTLVIAFDVPVRVGWQGGSIGEYWSLASGLHTRAAEIRHDGFQHGIQVSLTALGARRLLGMPIAALAAEIVPLADVVDRSWQERLSEVPTWAGRYALLDRLLLGCLEGYEAGGLRLLKPELARAMDRIEARSGRVSIADVAADVGWSRRHLGACFRTEVGLTPKEFARVARFDRSRVGLARAVPAAEVAARCGYADQAHLTREWRSMAGYSPVEWQRAELPFLQDFLGPVDDDGLHD